jgi:ArsR family transcriptional regulator
MKRDIPRRKAEFFKALGHPVRIRVLELLVGGEQTVGSLLEQIDAEQSHLSQQLGVLRRAELVESRREGSSVVYSLADERIEELLAVSREILVEQLRASQHELQIS